MIKLISTSFHGSPPNRRGGLTESCHQHSISLAFSFQLSKNFDNHCVTNISSNLFHYQDNADKSLTPIHSSIDKFMTDFFTLYGTFAVYVEMILGFRFQKDLFSIESLRHSSVITQA